MRAVVVGWDQSINHGAMCALSMDGQSLYERALVERVKDLGEESHRIPTKVREGDRSRLRRLRWLREWFAYVCDDLVDHVEADHDGRVQLYVAIPEVVSLAVAFWRNWVFVVMLGPASTFGIVVSIINS